MRRQILQAMVAVLVCASAQGVTLTTLVSFNGTNGVYPGELVQSTNGDFYGITFGLSPGTVFQMTPNGTLTTLVWFNYTNGFGPRKLLEGADGNFYGTTSAGGEYSQGTVFRMTPNGMLTTLVSFNETNGVVRGELVQSTDGDFYGTTSGTVFRMTPNGTLTTLVWFNSTNGFDPQKLLEGADGNFYGTTYAGGEYNQGTVFRMTPNGMLVTLVSFNGTNGVGPRELVQSADGDFYGLTTSTSPGTVFRMTPNGTLTTLVWFNGTNGSFPWKLVEGADGNFYGTTIQGGEYNQGTVFRMTPNGMLTTLVSFNGTNGLLPEGLVQGADGDFYGTTVLGGEYNKGTVFRLSLTDWPTIINQPTNLFVLQGAVAQFAVSAAGNPSPNYQWRKNGVNIPTANSSTLTLNSVSAADSGGYSVVVSNSFGTVTSGLAWLGVYLPPSTPQPPPPPATPTTQVPSPTLTAAPRKPTSAQMIVFTGGGLVDPNKMTIVITHGWKVSASGWPTDMANALANRGFDATANIVAWDWHDNANARAPSTSAARTPSEGEALGNTLLSTLGANYNKPLHFIGHSFGTLVNCRAADYVHGDAPNSPGNTPGSTLKVDYHNTHMTLFDEAELVTAVNGAHVFFDILYRIDETTANIVDNFWSKVIPNRAAWIDNYLSEVGLPHRKAANVLLWRNGTAGVVQSHGYAYQWYALTIANPAGTSMGHRWSFEYDSLGNAPAPGTFYLQNANLDPWTLHLTALGSVEQFPLVAYPSLLAYRGLNALGGTVLGKYESGIEYAGNFVADTVQMFKPLIGQPVFVGNANSTPAYYVQEPTSQTYQAGWDLQFTVQGAPPSPMQTQGAHGPTPQDAGGDETNCPAYVWIPTSVPSTAVGMSFEFRLEGANTNEYITMGISNENYFTMEARFVDDAVWNRSSVIEIPEYAGHEIQLFFALNGVGCPRDGKLSVRGIQFYSPPSPILNFARHETNAVLSWPVACTDWQLEVANTFSSSSQWSIVTNTPVVSGYEQTVTNAISGEARFYRLKK